MFVTHQRLRQALSLYIAGFSNLEKAFENYQPTMTSLDSSLNILFIVNESCLLILLDLTLF